jgi:hypothetical protein
LALDAVLVVLVRRDRRLGAIGGDLGASAGELLGADEEGVGAVAETGDPDRGMDLVDAGHDILLWHDVVR